MLTVKEAASDRKGNRLWSVESTAGGGAVATYTTKAEAWRHAVYGPFTDSKTFPVVGPGGWFTARGQGRQAGWTSDPRQATSKPASLMTLDEITKSKAAMDRFIAARLGTLEVFMPDETTENPCAEVESRGVADYGPESGRNLAAGATGSPEAASDAPTEPEGTTTPDDTPEAATDDPTASLSDTDRKAYENFSHMAERAPEGSARSFWQSKADAILAK